MDAPIGAADLEAVYRHSFDAILITSPDGTILDANPAACRLLGYTVGELRALGRSGVADPTDHRWEIAVRERERRGHTRTRLAFRHADGSSVETELSATVFEVEGQARSAIIVRDIRDQVHLEQQLREAVTQQTHLALTDELTRLPNRRSFFLRAGDLLSRAVDSAGSLHLLVADVDDLKKVNDEHGHAAGDALLRLVARALQAHFSEAALVARLSGDEFAVVLLDQDPDRLEAKVSALPAQLRAWGEGHDLAFTPRLSVGMSTSCPGAEQGLDALLASADSLMYRAKGRRRT